MCPACITTVAWLAAGAASAGAFAALIAGRLGGKQDPQEVHEHTDDKGDGYGTSESSVTR